MAAASSSSIMNAAVAAAGAASGNGSGTADTHDPYLVHQLLASQQQQQQQQCANVQQTSNDASNVNGSCLFNGCFDWSNDEYLVNWRHVFIQSLDRILRQVHPQITAREDALLYVEELLLRLLGRFMTKPTPTTVAEVGDKVSKAFPSPIDKWALAEAQAAVDRGKKKAGLALPVDKVHAMLKEALPGFKVDDQVTLYLVAVLEYISRDILKVKDVFLNH